MNSSMKAEIEIFNFHADVITTSLGNGGGSGEWDDNQIIDSTK